jgi:hypothetical protein
MRRKSEFRFNGFAQRTKPGIGPVARPVDEIRRLAATKLERERNPVNHDRDKHLPLCGCSRFVLDPF